jgi:Caspase domain
MPNQPGLHALIIGVSAYPHLEGGTDTPAPDTYGMGQLTVAASTAMELYEWLQANSAKLSVPLATCRLLLAPSPGEPAAPDGTLEPTLDEVRAATKAWREDAATGPDERTLFYFAGHGVQRSKDDGVAMLADFGDGEGGALTKSFSIKNVFEGMAPTTERPDIARTQLYFIDACRAEPNDFARFSKLDPSDLWDVEHTTRDDRRAPIVFAAAPGTNAYGVPGGQTLFGQALLTCLSGGAGEEVENEAGDPEWRISSGSLLRALADCTEQLAADYGTTQDCEPAGRLGKLYDTIHVQLDETPDVELFVEVVPATASQDTSVEVLDLAQRGDALPCPLSPHPYRRPFKAGFYTFKHYNSPSQPPQVSRLTQLNPPLYRKRIVVK